MISASTTANAVRDLNDCARKAGPFAGHARWMLASGVRAEGGAFVGRVIAAVQTFDDFHPANDPHGEHDFGAFDLDGKRVFWKIDYYDQTLHFGSENPADPKVTSRVLTIMLAEEY